MVARLSDLILLEPAVHVISGVPHSSCKGRPCLGSPIVMSEKQTRSASIQRRGMVKPEQRHIWVPWKSVSVRIGIWMIWQLRTGPWE
jgi:hypothetical protein